MNFTISQKGSLFCLAHHCIYGPADNQWHTFYGVVDEPVGREAFASMHFKSPVLTQIGTALHKKCFGASPTTYSRGFWKKIRHRRELTIKDNSLSFWIAQSQASSARLVPRLTAIPKQFPPFILVTPVGAESDLRATSFRNNRSVRGPTTACGPRGWSSMAACLMIRPLIVTSGLISNIHLDILCTLELSNAIYILLDVEMVYIIPATVRGAW